MKKNLINSIYKKSKKSNKIVGILDFIRKKIMRIIPDKIYLKLMFKIKLNQKLNLKNPRTFNEKIQWLKLYDRNPRYVDLVDKYKVREYIEKMIGKKYLIPLLGVYNSFDEIDFENLPNQFVIKSNHDSGGLVICKDKNKFDKEVARKKIEKSLNHNYYYNGREWPYKNVKRKIIIEQYMEDKIHEDLIDYKIMCFNGKAEYTFVYSERFSNDGVKANFFDNSWNELNFERQYGKTKKKIKAPKNHKKMLQFSELIAKNMDFVRVDWYEVNGNLYFGEITFYPCSGFGSFEPIEWDYKLGEKIKLSTKK